MTRLLELPNPQRRALDLVKEVAEEKDCRPFLVGGPVRDLLLGRGSIDVDLTLEEGSSTLAGALAKKIGGRVRSFPQFLTYKVTAENLPDIDIATARREKYRKPGALPTVEPGHLKDDLLRRDFSINAIAMDLATGSLHDPANGERDLGERLIRVLHDRSFADDPTRIYRAIRLAERLGFTLEQRTAELLASAVDSGALQTVTRERVWRELFLAMEEEDAPRVLTALSRHGALDLLFPRRSAEVLATELAEVKPRIDSDEELDRFILYTGVLLRGDGASAAQLEGSGFSQKRARAVLQIANDLPRVGEALRTAKGDRQRFRLLRAVAPEVLTVLSTAGNDEQSTVARFRDFQRFSLPIRGNELEVPGGPHIARALERTREAVFTGEIGADDARAFARELALKYLNQRLNAPN